MINERKEKDKQGEKSKTKQELKVNELMHLFLKKDYIPQFFMAGEIINHIVYAFTPTWVCGMVM